MEKREGGLLRERPRQSAWGGSVGACSGKHGLEGPSELLLGFLFSETGKGSLSSRGVQGFRKQSSAQKPQKVGCSDPGVPMGSRLRKGHQEDPQQSSAFLFGTPVSHQELRVPKGPDS